MCGKVVDGEGLWEGRFVTEGEAGLIESRWQSSRLCSWCLGGGPMVDNGRVDGRTSQREMRGRRPSRVEVVFSDFSLDWIFTPTVNM